MTTQQELIAVLHCAVPQIDHPNDKPNGVWGICITCNTPLKELPAGALYRYIGYIPSGAPDAGPYEVHHDSAGNYLGGRRVYDAD